MYGYYCKWIQWYLLGVLAKNSTSTGPTKEDQFRAAVNNQKMNGTVKWPIEKRGFLSSASKPVLASFKNCHSMIHSVQGLHRNKDNNMRNRNSLGFSYCFSCRSFACRCLASLSRSHILLFWWSQKMRPVSPKNLKLLQTEKQYIICTKVALIIKF